MSTITSSTSTPRLSKTQTTIYGRFVQAGGAGFTFREIEREFTNLSPSRVRTVVSELVKLGLVKSSGQKVHSNRSSQTIWLVA